MPTTRFNVKRRLSNVIKRFKFEELESAVIPTFPEISWNRLRSKLIKCHEGFTTSNAIRIIQEAVNEANVEQKVLKDRLSTLEIIDISRHYKRRTWYAISIKGSNYIKTHLGKKEIKENIEENLESYFNKIVVKLATHNGITFLCIKDKPRSSRSQESSIYFALFLEQKYLFSSKKALSQSFITTMAKSLGYDDAKHINLMGKDILSLLKLLWNRKQGAFDIENISHPLKFKDADPIIKDIGVNFTQNKNRKEYADKCFGKNPPTVESLNVQGPSLPINYEHILADHEIKIGWEFHSSDVITLLKQLIEQQIFVLPLPYYISEFLMIGRNTLKLRSS